MPQSAIPPYEPSVLTQALNAVGGSGIVVMSAAGQTLHVNDALCRMVGWSREELVSQEPPFPYWPDNDAAYLRSLLEQAIAGRGPPDGTRVVLRRRSGERFPAEMFVAPLRPGDPTSACVANIIDLSARSGRAADLRPVEDHTAYATKAKLFALLDALPDLLFELSIDGVIYDYHSPRTDLLAAPPEAFLGRRYAEFLPAPAIEVIDAAVQEAAERNFSRGQYYAILTPTGTRWFEISVAAKALVEGEGQRFVALVRDVTERRSADKTAAELRIAAAISNAEQRWRFALEGSAQGVWDWDVAAGTVYYSPQYKHMLGYADDEPFDSSAEAGFARFHPQDMPALNAAVERHVRGETPHYTAEFRVRCKSGEWLWVESRGMVIERAEDGAPLRMIGTHHDISVQKQVATELERMRLVMAEGEKIAGFGSWEHGLATESLLWSAEQYRIHGLLPDGSAMAYQEWLDGCVHPDDLSIVDTTFRLAVAGAEDYELEHRIRRPDGRIRTVRQLGRPHRDAAGNLVSYLGSTLDVTEIHEAQQKIAAQNAQLAQLSQDLAHRADAAEAANKAKSSFLAHMSHEIRTPLNGIIGMAHLIRLATLTPQQADWLGKLVISAEHLLDVINAILDLSKIEAGKFTLDEAPLRVASVVANVVAMVENSARQKRLRLLTEVDPIPDGLVGDATRLQQALLNYVNNAVKFTDGGTITIRAKLARLDERGALVRLEVSDTGIGIQPEVLSKLFTSFEQGDTSSTRKFSGTGLGLAITRKIAELMGGETGAESQAGAGSTFWITVLLRGAAGANGPSPGASARGDSAEALRRAHAGARILLAEDNDINREVAVAILQHVSCVVDVAEDGEQAVSKATSNEYDLVLMDVQMPKMDGLEATRIIRRSLPSGKLPIIAMTANVCSDDKAKCHAAGMDGFIAKPVDPEDLYSLLSTWLERRRAW